MNPAAQPQILTAAVGTSVSTLTPTVKMGAVIIENLDPTYSVFITWDGTTPVAGFGNGAKQCLPGSALNLNLDEVSTIKAICSTGESANVQATCRPQSGPISGT